MVVAPVRCVVHERGVVRRHAERNPAVVGEIDRRDLVLGQTDAATERFGVSDDVAQVPPGILPVGSCAAKRLEDPALIAFPAPDHFRVKAGRVAGDPFFDVGT